MSPAFARYLELQHLPTVEVRRQLELRGVCPPRTKKAAMARLIEKETGAKIRPGRFKMDVMDHSR